MISGIGGSNTAHSLLAQVESRKTQGSQQAAGATPTAAQDAGAAPALDGQAADGGASMTRSVQSAAVDRLGEQLNAQADAARLREASGEAAADESGTSETTTASTASTGTAAASGGARTGGAAASSGGSDSESTDYIAEADTNNDRKVSEQERIAYEKKQARQAEKSAQDVRQAYMPPEAGEAGLDVTA